jgi:hypothetical protein
MLTIKLHLTEQAHYLYHSPIRHLPPCLETQGKGLVPELVHSHMIPNMHSSLAKPLKSNPHTLLHFCIHQVAEGSLIRVALNH